MITVKRLLNYTVSLALGLCLMLTLIAAPLSAAAQTKPPNPKKVQEMNALRAKITALQVKGRAFAVLKLQKKMITLVKSVFGSTHALTVAAMQAYSGALMSTGDYAGALAVTLRILRIQEQKPGVQAQMLAIYVDAAAAAYWVSGNYKMAEKMYRRSLAIREKALGPNSVLLVTNYTLLAGLFLNTYAYSKAEHWYKKALKVAEKSGGPSNSMVAGPLAGLANLYWTRGDFKRAIRLNKRIVTIWTKLMGPKNLTTVVYMQMHATRYRQQGMLKEAEPLEKRAIAAYLHDLSEKEKRLGKNHYELATPLLQLAGIHNSRKEFAPALAYMKRALAIQESKYGKYSLSVTGTLIALGNTYRYLKRYPEAIKMMERAFKVQKKSWGVKQATTSAGLLAYTYSEAKQYKKALTLARKIVSQYRKTYGKAHPFTAMQLAMVVGIHLRRGDAKGAVQTMLELQKIVEPHVALMLSTGTEADKRAYMHRVTYHLDMAVGIHAMIAPNDPSALKLALSMILQRKGRILDAVADSVSLLRRQMGKRGKQLLDKLTAARARLAKLVLAGPKAAEPGDYVRKIAELEDQVRKLEAAVSAESAVFRAQNQPVTIAAVRNEVPGDAVLVEMVEISTLTKKLEGDNWYGPRHFIAYVVPKTGPITWVDLGQSGPIRKAVKAFRGALANPGRDDVETLARDVYKRVMQPIRRLLGQTRKILLSPDGDLNLIPFGALMDENGRYLVRRYTFTYLTSGRDLLRMKVTAKPKSGYVIFANPLFTASLEERSVKTGSTMRGRRSRALRNVDWSQLPGTASEAEALAKAMPKAQVFLGKDATEQALKAVRAPRVLHVATHGFFLPHQRAAISDGSPSLGMVSKRQRAGMENPLLRSGLVLAGANQLESGTEDGVLTALEAGSLDLMGTKLVVLSACETGVGEVDRGEGVQGLRRALVMAGAESQVMSLWQVDDDATRDLMVNFYTQLIAGKERSESLRRVQMKMLKLDKYKHPFYWAGFIPSGRWGPM
jgi:CHAT domain-containing protein